MATVVLLGTLDTKGREYEFLRDQVQAEGCEVLLVDAGIVGPPQVTPDISASSICCGLKEAGSSRQAAAIRLRKSSQGASA